LANEIATIKAQAEVELNKIKAESSAKTLGVHTY
jgi:hypothetical protein